MLAREPDGAGLGAVADRRWLLLNIGAGCGPGWRNSALTRIATAAMQRDDEARPRRGGSSPSALRSDARSPRRCRYRRHASHAIVLRTDLSPDVGPTSAARRSAAVADRRGLAAPARRLAIDRQADGDAGALAEPARDLDLAAVQRQQSLDDRKAEPGAVVAAVVGRARLEERIADARQIVAADADAGVLDRSPRRWPSRSRAHRDLAAALA